MSSKRIPNRKTPAGRLILVNQGGSRLALAVAMIIVAALGASARNELLRGHVTINERRSDGATKPAAPMTVTASDLAAKYGSAASSPAVARAIKKAESAPDARAVAGAQEALAHGVCKPGADSMLAIMYGYVPPGMSQEQASMLYKTLPHLPRIPQPITADGADRYAGVRDPEGGLPQELSRKGIQAANEQMLSGYMRERLGPVSLLPLHRDHNDMALTKAAEDHSGSIREMTDSSGNIVYQQTYDPFGNPTELQGTTQPDFGYDGYYVHQRSGLNLTKHRAYSPKSGRWLSRDPIQDPTFGSMPQSPEPRDPGSMVANGQTTPAIQITSPALAPMVQNKNRGALLSAFLPRQTGPTHPANSNLLRAGSALVRRRPPAPLRG